ncbi:MAG: hypothetical protein PUK70_09875 [Bacteroidales bacterium]|nr:hypothetical protein [Bacteroidales bacterium]MDY6000938.1 hypothetical protein [Candidatus Cryptobacteroides sp.]
MGNKIDYEYAAFEALMDQDRIFLDESLNFNDICAQIGADAQALEQKIAEELGYLGDELLEVYRDKSLL